MPTYGPHLRFQLGSMLNRRYLLFRMNPDQVIDQVQRPHFHGRHMAPDAAAGRIDGTQRRMFLHSAGVTRKTRLNRAPIVRCVIMRIVAGGTRKNLPALHETLGTLNSDHLIRHQEVIGRWIREARKANMALRANSDAVF
jgi:hypothetical protein